MNLGPDVGLGHRGFERYKVVVGEVSQGDLIVILVDSVHHMTVATVLYTVCREVFHFIEHLAGGSAVRVGTVQVGSLAAENKGSTVLSVEVSALSR